MGIKELHKFLARTSSRNNLSKLRGSVLGIDAMCWLHRGCVSGAYELLTGQDTDKFLRFFVKMLMLCNTSGVKPIVVFDGASIPAKAAEEAVRRERRLANTEKAKEEIASRKITSVAQVDPKLRSMIIQAISVTSDMITRTMSVLRRLGVDFIVAPYEADAQLAYMYKQGVISGVVSEDSDLLAFGCHRLISKLDVNGDFMDVSLEWAFQGPDMPTKPPNVGELGKLEKWTPALFTDLCILAGSDYKFGKIFGIGIKTAFDLLCKYMSVDRLVAHIGEKKKWSKEEVSTYLSEFSFSKNAFMHHRVFDIKHYLCVTVEGVTPDQEKEEKIAIPITVVGEPIPPELVKGVLTGELDAKKNFEKRIFLDRLPPGVFGRYRDSLRAQSKSVSDPLPVIDVSQYDQLEQQIISEFSKLKRVSSEHVQVQNQLYLSNLQSMILGSVPDNEFDNIDEILISLDDDDDEGKIDSQKELENVSPNKSSSQPTIKPKNPFAKLNQAPEKKLRTSIGTSCVVAPSADKKTNITDFLRRESLGGNKPTVPFLSSNDASGKPKPAFVRRSFH